MPGDVLFENPPLPDDLRDHDVELVAADAEDRFVVRESTIGAFPVSWTSTIVRIAD